MIRAHQLVLLAPFLGATFATTSRARAADPDLACTWQKGDTKLACTAAGGTLDASRAFTVAVTGLPAEAAVSVKYGESPGAPGAKAVKCSKVETGFSCPKRDEGGTGLILLAKSGNVTASYSGATKLAVKAPADDKPPAGGGNEGEGKPDVGGDAGDGGAGKPSDAGVATGTPPPVGVIDNEVEKKLTGALPEGPKDLVKGDGYSYSDARVLIVLNSAAQPLRPIPDIIDERDEIWIAIVDWKPLMKDLSISISGCNRPPIEARVFGEAAAPPAKAHGAAPLELGAVVFRNIGKCAGADTGGPVVTVKNSAGSSNATIPINPVYTFVVGVGLGADLTTTTNLGVVTPQGATVATINETDDRIGLTGLLYVGWYPLGRDFRKIHPRYIPQRAVLFVGLDPHKLDESLIVGGGVNIVTGMDLLVGWRVLTKRTELQSGSGLAVGKPFDGPASSLPTTQVWGTGGLFVGVGVTNALLAKLH